MKLTQHEKASVVDDCATKVGAWSTAHLPHETALVVQLELLSLAYYLRARSKAIRAGTVKGVYDA